MTEYAVTLCLNCMDVGAVKGVRVGPTKGTQRDPYQDQLLLCGPCGEALVEGNFSRINARYSAERRVDRTDPVAPVEVQ